MGRRNYLQLGAESYLHNGVTYTMPVGESISRVINPVISSYISPKSLQVLPKQPNMALIWPYMPFKGPVKGNSLDSPSTVMPEPWDTRNVLAIEAAGVPKMQATGFMFSARGSKDNKNSINLHPPKPVKRRAVPKTQVLSGKTRFSGFGDELQCNLRLFWLSTCRRSPLWPTPGSEFQTVLSVTAFMCAPYGLTSTALESESPA